MCILMMFNSRQQLSFKDIKDEMKFDDDTCSKNLKSMSMKNFKIIEHINSIAAK